MFNFTYQSSIDSVNLIVKKKVKIKPMNKEYIEDRKIKIIDPSKVDIN